MRASNMFDTAVQTNKTSSIKHENKRNVLSCLIEYLMAFKFYQTRSNSTKQGCQTVKCLDNKQCLMVFGRQTFPVWTGLYGVMPRPKQNENLVKVWLRVCTLCGKARRTSQDTAATRVRVMEIQTRGDTVRSASLKFLQHS